MNPQQKIFSGQRMALLIALMALVTGVYMLTYSARMGFTDTRFLFDATESLVRDGDMRLDLTNGERRFWDYEPPLPDVPLVPVNAEPLQILLAAGLYQLSDALPGVGYVHGVWLFNVLVGALAVGVFYLYTLQLGYRARTAIVGALLFAFCTNLWAYSKTFFQEPLTLLLIFLATFFIERWRSTGYRNLDVLVVGLLTFALAFFARRASLVALPALIIIAFPGMDAIFRQVRVRRAFFALVSAGIAGLFVASVFKLVPFAEALHGYFFAPGGSLWATSPVLLLAVPGVWLLMRQNRMRYGVAALVMYVLYAGAYAYGSGDEWFGGLSFPPRFLVPVIPFVMLCTLPIIDYVVGGGRRYASPLRVVFAIVVLYGLWIQFNAVSYWWGEYTALLPAQANELTEWRGGLDNPRYFRWVLLPQLWGERPFDFVWVRTGEPLFPLIFGGLAVLAAVSLWLVQRGRVFARSVIVALPVATAAALFFGMQMIYEDDLYLAFSDGLASSLPTIRAELDADDILLISQPGYELYYMNYGDIDGIRLITLPFHQGERPNPDATPVIESPNPARLLERPTIQLINTFAQNRDSLWVLSHSSPFITWSVRPLERYMALHHYPLRTIDLTAADGLPVRLLEYGTVHSPAPLSLTGAEAPTDLRYSDAIQLAGYTLPAGDTYAPGDVLPVSLLWVTDAPLEGNYTVAMHLAGGGSGVVASAEDSQPYAGFAQTQTWRVNSPVWDNRALRVPAELEPGAYELWVALYSVNESGEVALLDVSGGKTAESGAIGVLPTMITVR